VEAPLIRFACPVCQRIFAVPDKAAGKKGTCPKCGQRVQVPRLSGKTVLGRPIPDPAPHSPSAPVAQPAAQVVNATCPGCGRSIPLGAHELSLTIECAVCNTQFMPARPSAPAARVMEPGQVYQPAVSSGRRAGCVVPLLLLVVGVVLFVLGAYLVWYFGQEYDTTVPVYPQLYGKSPLVDEWNRRVYNTGLMQNRLIGIIVGIACAIGGLALATCGAVMGRRR
jgi:hypothetical protein